MTAPAFADPNDAAAYAAYVQGQATEYGMWVAASDIMVGAVLGFTEGMSVPASTVAAQGWDKSGLVRPAPNADPAALLRSRKAALEAELAALTEQVDAAEEAAGTGPYTGPEWKADALKAELAKRELDTTGTKAAMVARLIEHDATRATEEG
jgi:hypothetical protein